MKTLRILAVSAAVMTASHAFAADESISSQVSSFFAPLGTAEFYKPFSVRAEVGSLGYGGAVAYDVDPITTLVVGYNGGDSTDILGHTYRWDGVKYKTDIDSNNTYLNLEIHPIPQARWVNLAFGVAYIDDQYAFHQKSHNGFINVNNKYFDATNSNVRGKLSYRDNVAPFLGLGVTPQLTKNIGLFAQVGAYLTGHPDANLQSNEVINDKGQSLNKALRETQHNIRSNDQYNFLPEAKMGLTLHY